MSDELEKIMDDFEVPVMNRTPMLHTLESYIRSRQLDKVDQFRDHIEGAYAAVEVAMGEAYYQITQADKKGSGDE